MCWQISLLEHVGIKTIQCSQFSCCWLCFLVSIQSSNLWQFMRSTPTSVLWMQVSYSCHTPAPLRNLLTALGHFRREKTPPTWLCCNNLNAGFDTMNEISTFLPKSSHLGHNPGLLLNHIPRHTFSGTLGGGGEWFVGDLTVDVKVVEAAISSETCAASNLQGPKNTPCVYLEACLLIDLKKRM